METKPSNSGEDGLTNQSAGIVGRKIEANEQPVALGVGDIME